MHLQRRRQGGQLSADFPGTQIQLGSGITPVESTNSVATGLCDDAKSEMAVVNLQGALGVKGSSWLSCARATLCDSKLLKSSHQRVYPCYEVSAIGF